MHDFAQYMTELFAPLKNLALLLAGVFAHFSSTPLGIFAVAAIAVTSIAIGLGCGAWAVGERLRSLRYRDRMLATLRRQQVALHFRDALIGSLPEAVVVLRANTRSPLEFSGGSVLLRHCLAGPDAIGLAKALEDLLTRGTAFMLSVRTIGIREMVVRGRCVGDSAAIFIQNGRSLTEYSRHATAAPVPAAQSRPTGNVAGLLAIVDAPASQPSSRDAAAKTCPSTDGVIVIGPDGRLKQHNATFARQWSLREEDLAAHPHVREIAALCANITGRDGIWNVVAAAAASAQPERYNDWGTLARGDGQAVELTMSRLRAGDTLVAFAQGRPTIPRQLAAYDTLAVAA